MPRAHANLLVFLIATAAVVAGWHLCWFLTDDAFIQFRYVSNSILGHGYVWNPPPFLPVEGYTSFLWVLLLDGVWRVAGIPPPRAACGLALVFALLSLWLTGRMVLEMRLGRELGAHRVGWLALVLAGLASHRTFLTWTSSGLETALFNFTVLLWFHAVVRLAEVQSPRRMAGLAASAALVYLARPDGLLYGASTLFLCGAWLWRRRAAGAPLRHAAAWIPLLVIPAHLAWRKSFYGEWLPNTYYAKVVGAWPEAGWRYALSFVLEHGLWLWIACFIVLSPRLLRGPGPAGRARRWEWAVGLAVSTLIAHAAYYVLVVGGDHFEYRALSYSLPFLPLSLLWLLDRSSVRAPFALALGAAFVALAAPIPWLHWRLAGSQGVPGEALPIAPHLPRPLRWYGELFDQTQAWLIERSVCNRRHEHVATYRNLQDCHPERSTLGADASGDRPILRANAVGVHAWNLPHVAILDTKGLNDYVVARTRLPAGHERRMAHDRNPPAGYLSEYRPNVRVLGEAPFIEVRQRTVPLDDARLAELERKWHRRAREWVAGCHRRWPVGRGNLLVIDLGVLCSDRIDPLSAPRLEALAGECFVFERATSSSAAGIPSAVSLMTSLRPEVHGASSLAGGPRVPERATTLAGALQSRGYATAAFVETGLGLERGFDLYAEIEAEASVADRVMDWLGEPRAAPFFAYVRVAPASEPSTSAAHHDARLRLVDHEVGALLDALAEVGIEERTLVAVVSSHGVELDDVRDQPPHLALFEQVLPMVLMMRVPGYYFEPGTLASAASTIDLMPTLLDLLGLEEGALIQGQSLVPAMRYEDTGTAAVVDFDAASGLASLRLGSWCLLAETGTGRSWLYLEDKKPGPAQDLSRANPDVTEDLRAALEGALALRSAEGLAARDRLGL